MLMSGILHNDLHTLCNDHLYKSSNSSFPHKNEVKFPQLCLTFCNPIDYSPRDSPGQNTRVGSLSLCNPEIEPRSLALQVDSLPAEPPGKPIQSYYYIINIIINHIPYVVYYITRVYLSYFCKLVTLNSLHLFCPHPTPFPLRAISLLSSYMNLLLFCFHRFHI